MEQAKGRLPQARRARKTNPTYLNSILMISLVLVLLGSVGTVLLLAQIYGEAIKEQVRVSAYLKDNVNEVEMLQLRKKIEAEPFARSIEYISKDEALQKFMARERDTLAQQILGDINPFRPLLRFDCRLPMCSQIPCRPSVTGFNSIARCAIPRLTVMSYPG